MAVTGVIERTVDINHGVVQEDLHRLFAVADAQAHTFKITVNANGVAQSLSGHTVIGYFMRNAGGTVVINGSVSGNVATLVLPQSCYSIIGGFQLIIRLVSGSTKTAIYWATGYITRSTTDPVVDPGSVVPDLNDLLAKIDQMEQATQAANTAAANANTAAEQAVRFDTAQTKTDAQKLQARNNAGAAGTGSLAPAYAQITYAVGDMVTHEGKLYKCTTAITTAEAWTAGHWTEVAVSDEITNLKEDLSQISEVIGSETKDIYDYTPVEFNFVEGSWIWHGVTYTQNSDGTATVSGTNDMATNSILFSLRSAASTELTIPLTAGDKYRLSGCPVGGGADTYSLSLRYASGGAPLVRDFGSGVIYDIPQSTDYKIHVIIAKGNTINKTFTPKLEKMTVIGQETVDILTAKDTVARDGKVDKQQSLEDAGKVLVVGEDGALTPMEYSSGLSDEAKKALLACFRHVVWSDDDESYYSVLETALEVEPEKSLTVSFEPGSHIIYTNDALTTLTPYLTVIYYDSPSSSGEVISSNDYTLSGTLSAGRNSISVKYLNLTTTFDVIAIDFYDVWKWEYKADGSGNLTKLSKDAFDMSLSGTLRGIFTGTAATFSKVRTFVTDRGKAPMRKNASPYDYFTPYMYPIPVPSRATRAVCTVTPSTYKINVFLFRYLNDSTLISYDYTQITSQINQVGTATLSFSAGSNLFLAMYLNNADITTITTEPEFLIQFS